MDSSAWGSHRLHCRVVFSGQGQASGRGLFVGDVTGQGRIDGEALGGQGWGVCCGHGSPLF